MSSAFSAWKLYLRSSHTDWNVLLKFSFHCSNCVFFCNKLDRKASDCKAFHNEPQVQ